MKKRKIKRVRILPIRRKCIGKGAKYERKIATRLSQWISNFTRDDLFWRSAMSGGRHTVRKRGPYQKTKDRRCRSRSASDAHAGDIVCTHKLGQDFMDFFVVECKHYKDLKLSKLLFGLKGEMVKFWEKLLGEGAGRRQPFLCVRENFKPDLVFTSETGYRFLRSGGSLPLLAHFPKQGMYVLLLRDVLMLDWEPVKALIQLHVLREGKD